MKKFIYLFLPIALFSCENSENKMFLENKGSNFKNYTYQPKEVINGQNKELNYKTETKCIGTTQIDSLEYRVFTEFRKIQLEEEVHCFLLMNT